MTRKGKLRFSFDKSHRNFIDPKGPRHIDNDIAPKTQRQQKTFKVVSYNIRFGRKIEGALRFFKTSKKLKDIDVLCLQEMDVVGVERIAQALQFNYVYYPAVIHPVHNKEFGNAILTRWPITSDEKIILPHLDEKKLQRIAVGAVISVNGKRVKVFSVHTKVFLTLKYRISQAERIIQSIPKNIKYSIVAGDFNTFTKTNFQAVTDVFKDYGFATDGIDWTYKHWYLLNKKTKLDHIFVRGFETIVSEKILYRKSSDHLPIWTELRFK